jgi:hypothetical protein
MDCEGFDFFKINIKEIQKNDFLIYENQSTTANSQGFERIFKSLNTYNKIPIIPYKNNFSNFSLFDFIEPVKVEIKKEVESKREEKKIAFQDKVIEKEKIDLYQNSNLSTSSLNKEVKKGLFKNISIKHEPLAGTGIFKQQKKEDVKPLTTPIVTISVNKEEAKEVPKVAINKVESTLSTNLPIQSVKKDVFESKFKKQLLDSANHYWDNIRLKIKEISEDKSKKRLLDKIVTEVNIVIQQFSSEADIDRSVSKIKSILKELISQYNLYIYCIDYLIKCLLIKSEKYLNEDKINYVVFAKLISLLSKDNVLIRNYFLHMIAYKCPYIIPKIFSDKEYPDEKIRRKRLGFSDTSTENERLTDFLNNMECYSYLYFNFLLLCNIIEIIKDYTNSLLTVTITHPIGSVFKVFLYILGSKVKELEGMQKLTDIFIRMTKTLEEIKNKTTQGDIKSVLSANIRLIKKYHLNLKDNKKIDS